MARRTGIDFLQEVSDGITGGLKHVETDLTPLYFQLVVQVRVYN